MTTPQVFVHNFETGEQYVRDMTDAEIAELFETPINEESAVDLVEGEQP
jgi:hypothetical protein